VKGTINLLAQLSALLVIQLYRGAGQPPISPVADCHHHPQIAGQFGNGRRRRLGLALPLGFQK
jgi:hypothetical protein